MRWRRCLQSAGRVMRGVLCSASNAVAEVPILPCCPRRRRKQQPSTRQSFRRLVALSRRASPCLQQRLEQAANSDPCACDPQRRPSSMSTFAFASSSIRTATSWPLLHAAASFFISFSRCRRPRRWCGRARAARRTRRGHCAARCRARSRSSVARHARAKPLPSQRTYLQRVRGRHVHRLQQPLHLRASSAARSDVERLRLESARSVARVRRAANPRRRAARHARGVALAPRDVERVLASSSCRR